jgi:BirA family biotin operon repressor/biotin-[acetyl-CoA-carboxylase] ligase
VRVDRVGSTNDLARALAEEGAREGTVVVAREQTGGRGRMGRAWASPPGGLWLSVLLQPDDPADPRLALVVGIGVVEALRGNAGAAIGLKWPNDLMLGGRKVGGVLVESAPPWAVAGIGVNVNVDRADLPAGVRAAAVSLAEVLGRHLDLEEVGASVLTGLDEVYAAYRAGRTAEVLARWRRLSVTTGRLVRVQAGGRVIEGTALDIDDDGALLVVPPGGTPQRLLGGDVTVLDGGGRG